MTVTILASFDLQITPIVCTKFPVSGPFSSGEEIQNILSRWQLYQPSRTSDWNNFSYSWSISCSYTFYQVLSQLAFPFRRRISKQIFKMVAMAEIFDFLVDYLSYFWSKSPQYFQYNRPFGEGEEFQNRFSKWQPWWPSMISSWHNFSYFFYLQVIPILPTKFQVNWPFSSGEEVQIRFSRWQLSYILYFWSKQLELFLIYKLLWYFLPSFKSNGLSVQEMKFNLDFYDGCHLGFLIKTILASFDLQVAQILPTKF